VVLGLPPPVGPAPAGCAGTTVGPQCGGDTGGPARPVIASQEGLRQVEGVQQVDDVGVEAACWPERAVAGFTNRVSRCPAGKAGSTRGQPSASSGITPSYELPQWPECAADLRCEQLGLLPGGEVTALIDLVPVDEVAEGPLAPAPRRPVDLRREHRDRDRESRDADGVERAAAGLRAFPVGPRRRCPGVGQRHCCIEPKGVLATARSSKASSTMSVENYDKPGIRTLLPGFWAAR
jgi:hypothetical protein